MNAAAEKRRLAAEITEALAVHQVTKEETEELKRFRLIEDTSRLSYNARVAYEKQYKRLIEGRRLPEPCTFQVEGCKYTIPNHPYNLVRFQVAIKRELGRGLKPVKVAKTLNR